MDKSALCLVFFSEIKVNSEIFFLHVGGYEGMQTCIKVNEKKYLFNGKGRTYVTCLFMYVVHILSNYPAASQPSDL